MAATKRIEWLDIAKGIGIILVIAGHCIKLSHWSCQLIFAFHMPLFFALSGYTFSTKDSFGRTVFKKSKTLLVPFLAFFTLGLVVTCLIPAWKNGLTPQGLLQDIILADPSNVHNSSIWFLVCLFFVVLVFWVLNKLPLWLQPILIAGLYILGVWYSEIRADHTILFYTRLPLNWDVVPIGLVFYALGFYARRSRITEKLQSHVLIELAVTVVSLVLLVLVYKKNGYMNTHGLEFGKSSILFLLAGFFGTVALVGVSMLVERLFTKDVFYDAKRILLWYGRNSLLVLGFQSLLIRLYVLAFNTFKGTQLGMYTFPWSHAINSTILVTFVFSPALVWGINAIKRGYKALCARRTADVTDNPAEERN